MHLAPRWLIALFGVAYLMCATGHADEVRTEKLAIDTAEKTGRQLFDALNRKAFPDASTVESARARISDWCDFAYVPVQMSGGEPATVFFIAQPRQAGSMVFGRHYMVKGAAVTPSTVSCFEMPPAPPGMVGASITHLLSPYPTDFHVFLSLFHKTPIFIATSKGIWETEDGRIRLIQPR